MFSHLQVFLQGSTCDKATRTAPHQGLLTGLELEALLQHVPGPPSSLGIPAQTAGPGWGHCSPLTPTASCAAFSTHPSGHTFPNGPGNATASHRHSDCSCGKIPLAGHSKVSTEHQTHRDNMKLPSPAPASPQCTLGNPWIHPLPGLL